MFWMYRCCTPERLPINKLGNELAAEGWHHFAARTTRGLRVQTCGKRTHGHHLIRVMGSGCGPWACVSASGGGDRLEVNLFMPGSIAVASPRDEDAAAGIEGSISITSSA